MILPKKLNLNLKKHGKKYSFNKTFKNKKTPIKIGKILMKIRLQSTKIYF